MHPLAKACKDLMDLGVLGDALVAAINRVEEAIYIDRFPDPVTERRREKDRDRKRAEKTERDAEKARNLRNSTESTETVESVELVPLALSPSPQTPQPHTHPPPSITTGAKADLAKPFAEFWATYPRKVGKPNALDAYRKAWGRLERSGLDPPSEILAGLHRQLDGFSQREPDLVPHPTTWLNRDGWDDQPDTPRQPQPRQANERSHPDQKHLARLDNYRAAAEGAQAASRIRQAGG